jgi:GMP synthase-like glutamine amidotransferase
MTKKFLVFQHSPHENVSLLLRKCSSKHDIELHTVEIWHKATPDISKYDGLIVLGGTPNIDQEDTYPFLQYEKILIQRALDADMPYLGFCLGHQLLADAFGATVGPNSSKSVGFIPGHLTKSGYHHPVFQGIPSPFPLFKWHEQAILPPLPKEIEVLVTSEQCSVEAISIVQRPHIIGLQFDNYAATLAQIKKWIQADNERLIQGSVDTRALLHDAKENASAIAKHFKILFENYIQAVEKRFRNN